MMSKHLSLRYVLKFKKIIVLALANQKIYFWGVPGGVTPQTMSKYSSSKHLLLISKNTGIAN